MKRGGGADGAEGGPEGAPAGRGGERKGFLLRLPPRMLAELREWANHDLRSLNGQIEFLLRRALEESGRGKRGRAQAAGELRDMKEGADE